MSKSIQAQFQGFIKTPNLWFGNAIYNLQQLDLNLDASVSFKDALPKPIRLGKRVEQFVFHALKLHPDVSVLAENIQIQQEKRTIGELDGLLLVGNKPIHLEIIYKFYVYDATVGSNELDHWIGPNRKDSLVAKLEKLKNKQLPLLYYPETKRYLDAYNLDLNDLEQQVLFKAQLFVPYLLDKTDYNLVHEACISGFYLKRTELSLLTECKFYMPSKAKWLVVPFVHVSWQGYFDFIAAVNPVLDQQTAPLVWIKYPNGRLEKSFVVWW